MLEKENFMIMKEMKNAVLETAKRLCEANGKVTTLEIKTELRTTQPYFHWRQNSTVGVTGVSEFMDQLANEGKFTFVKDSNNNYRIYTYVNSVKTSSTKKNPTKNTSSINRTKAFELMRDSKGHFFTAVFTKQDGSKRTINCQYMKDQETSNLGYVKVKEANKLKKDENPIRQINLQTIESLKIGGKLYTVK
jgi:hypothetical protein